MTKSKSIAIDTSTEEKIKEAARTVFHKKGFAATRTRDIAEEAGINLALLNYYFRSKQRLFELIMVETTAAFSDDGPCIERGEKFPGGKGGPYRIELYRPDGQGT